MPSGPEPFDSDDAQTLVRAQQDELRGLDGAGDIGPAREAWMFEPPDGVFVVSRVDGRPVGCGGICRYDETRAELKRMYVVPDARGLGLGRELLVALEAHARASGYAGIVLETGELQRESLGLYTSSGYAPIPCYGVYAERKWSRCFEKML